jgi:hypothetical protein
MIIIIFIIMTRTGTPHILIRVLHLTIPRSERAAGTAQPAAQLVQE